MGYISSINFKKSKDFQVYHNSDIRPNYAIGGGLEVNCNHKEALSLKNEIIANAMENYTKLTRQKFQAKSYEWSAVVNIKPNTTMQDLEKLSAHFSDKYGFQCYQIAIHRDEGHINELGEKVINHHAHLEFITLDKNTGKNNWQRRHIGQNTLRQIQTEVAEILQMERGIDKRLSGAKRVEPRKYAVMKEREKAERKADLEKINDLKADNNILEQMAESTKQERDRLKSENATLKEKNAELRVENDFLKGENERLKQEILTQKAINTRIEQERKAWIEEKNHIAEDYKRLRELKNQKEITNEQLESQIKELNEILQKERKLRENTESKNAELEAKTSTNIDKRDSTFKNIADKDFKEILAESNISIKYDFTNENNAVYTNSTLYLPKAKEIRDKLEHKGYYVSIIDSHSTEFDMTTKSNRFALAFAKTKYAFEKVCEYIANTTKRAWESIYQTSDFKLEEIKEQQRQESKKTLEITPREAEIQAMKERIKESVKQTHQKRSNDWSFER